MKPRNGVGFFLFLIFSRRNELKWRGHNLLRRPRYVATMWHGCSNSMTWISRKSPSFKYSILFVGPRILIFDSENKVTVVTVAL